MRNGDRVTLVSPYGSTTGTLVLNEWEQRWANTSAYAIWTLTLDDGQQYRSEGRLTSER